MTRSYTTPAAFKTSLEARLRSRARSTGTDLQRLRQLVVYDRFLARLFEADTTDIVLKGGLALELRSDRARATKDVDLHMTGTPSSTLKRLQDIGHRALGDFLHFEVAPDPKHPTIKAEASSMRGAGTGCRLSSQGRCTAVRSGPTWPSQSHWTANPRRSWASPG